MAEPPQEPPASPESFQALHADLLALSESRLLNVERLEDQLRAHISDFRRLLEKRPRSDRSRQTLVTGQIEIGEQVFQVNQDFQQSALQVADDLNLDELDAARICLESEAESRNTGRSLHLCAVIRFHQRRKYMLDCLCLMLQVANDLDREDPTQDGLVHVIQIIVKDEGSTDNSSKYVRTCLNDMTDIKDWGQKLVGKRDGFAGISAMSEEFEELNEYQRVSLVQQHESLGIITLNLVKMGTAPGTDLDSLLEIIRKLDKYDHLMLHYFPVLSALIEFSLQSTRSIADVRTLNEKILRQSDQTPWALTYVHAAIRAWWLAEYSDYFTQNHESNFTQDQLDEESRERSRQFMEALKDGAFDFMLSLSADVRSSEWPDPARNGLRQWLQRKAPALPQDGVGFSDMFQRALEDQLQSFIEAFINNMPDVLRKLRVDEDEQRQLSNNHDHDLHLERFITTVSYAFEGQPAAARRAFWDSPDGAPLGFLHWASKRASTPLVSAFVEMLRALSRDKDCATSTHEFLLDEGAQGSTKLRKTHSLTWNQIFKELTFFSSKFRNTPAAPQAYGASNANNDHLELEPESLLMLECYLRLITRLCTESGDVRTFLRHHPSFNLADLLFQLAGSSIASRLKACAFSCIRSLLSHKTKVEGDLIWLSLDNWVAGGFAPGATVSKPLAPVSAASSFRILTALRTGFEEPNAFIRLLSALVAPYEEEADLRDGLPFPESLGSASRMPGIDPYVDFALGQIFGSQTTELTDCTQARVLRLSCLGFIANCLRSFNEDLVIFAQGSNVAVDAAIHTSNLENYVLLHPFSRVMEWMYNETVMDALFASIQHDEREVLSSSPNSPLTLGLLKGIEAISLILDLQPTYLDIVQPLLKAQSSHRRLAVPNAAFSSFEDGVLNHLSLIANLGLYCGSGLPSLVIASLSLLQKLSASPKLVSAPRISNGHGTAANKAIAALKDEGERISMLLLDTLESEIDINLGPESPGHIMKTHVLEFLISCLEASPNHPSIGHRLLGFQCSKTALAIHPESPFNIGYSLFHGILKLVLDGDVGETAMNVSPWLVSFKLKGLQILKLLWQSPLSSNLVMLEMRASNAFALLFSSQRSLLTETFDDLLIDDPQFLPSDGASCLSDFLNQRSITFQYLSAELQQVASLRQPSSKEKILGTLSGNTMGDDGLVQHASIFDFFDFLDLDFGQAPELQIMPMFQDINFVVCLETSEDEMPVYQLDKVQELLLLRRFELVKARGQPTPSEEVQLKTEITKIITHFHIGNLTNLISASRFRFLQTWIQLVLLMLQTSNCDETASVSFILRTLETILPSLEGNIDNIPEATELTKLAKSLLFALDFESDAFKRGDLADLVSDRLFNLYQLSLRAIASISPNPTLKEYYYSISYRFLTGMSDVASIAGVHRRPTMKAIKAAGDRFIDVVCDDAYSGEPVCRISALMLLTTLVKMAQRENDTYAIDSLVRLNFVAILVDSISKMPSDLAQTPRDGVPLHLKYCHVRLVLLGNIAQTRPGATAVLNAGLFYSVQESNLFARDPDLGVDIDTPHALLEFYSLLTALMRLICATVLSRGTHNHHTLDQGRHFLSENRLSIMAVLKKSAGIGGEAADGSGAVIADLAEAYVLLMTLTGFLESEGEENVKRPGNKLDFT